MIVNTMFTIYLITNIVCLVSAIALAYLVYR